MALKTNVNNDWGELFDKFATVPEAEKKIAAGPDPDEQAKLAKQHADKKAATDKTTKADKKA